jgi:hypothetical protein
VRENRNPGRHRAGQEVRAVLLKKLIATAAHKHMLGSQAAAARAGSAGQTRACVPRQSLRSQAEPGNERCNGIGRPAGRSGTAAATNAVVHSRAATALPHPRSARCCRVRRR